MAKEKILEVQDISVILDGNLPVLSIKASGNVTSSGWKNPELVPHSFEQPPPDGIYDFDLVAEPPSGIDLPVVMPIETEYKLKQIPNNLKGIRVHTSTNVKEAKINEEKTMTKTKVFEVRDIGISHQEMSQMSLTASGTVNTAGWKDAELIPRPSPSGGKLEFDFVAQPPDSPVAQVITPIEAIYRLSQEDQNHNHFIVYASQNQKEIFLD
jgi:hypothetical protein